MPTSSDGLTSVASPSGCPGKAGAEIAAERRVTAAAILDEEANKHRRGNEVRRIDALTPRLPRLRQTCARQDGKVSRQIAGADRHPLRQRACRQALRPGRDEGTEDFQPGLVRKGT